MTGTVYAVAGAALLALGLHALFARRHLLRRIIAGNVAAGGAFLVVVGPAHPDDPVPEALVLTGIVISVSITAFALSLLRRLHADTGRVTLDEEPPEAPGAGAP